MTAEEELHMLIYGTMPGVPAEHYTCGMCGSPGFDSRAEYVEHLKVEHPETWLARRVAKETERRETNDAAPK